MRTPTPWNQDDGIIYGPDGLVDGKQAERAIVCCDDWRYNKLGMLSDTDKANIAFILKACNVHEELVAALKLYVKADNDQRSGMRLSAHDRSECYHRAVEALEKAKED